MPHAISIVICEGRQTTPDSQSLQEKLIAELARCPEVKVRVLPHLYDLDPAGPAMRYLRSVQGDMIVLAPLFPAAAYWILDATEVKGRRGPVASADEEDAASKSDDRPGADTARTIWCLDLRGHAEAGPLFAEIERLIVKSTGRPLSRVDVEVVADGEGAARLQEVTQPRWYPVINYDRCANCLECLNFCLFGVFGIDVDGQLIAEVPDACRDGCPACARVCPSHAIMFPHHDNPAIAGDPNASPGDRNVTLVQLLGALAPDNLAATVSNDLAAAERTRAMAEKKVDAAPKPPPAPADDRGEKDELDALVDDLDAMNL